MLRSEAEGEGGPGKSGELKDPSRTEHRAGRKSLLSGTCCFLVFRAQLADHFQAISTGRRKCFKNSQKLSVPP